MDEMHVYNELLIFASRVSLCVDYFLCLWFANCSFIRSNCVKLFVTPPPPPPPQKKKKKKTDIGMKYLNLLLSFLHGGYLCVLTIFCVCGLTHYFISGNYV